MARILLLGLLCAATFGIYWVIANYTTSNSAANADVPTAIVSIMSLRDKVVEQGEVESQSTVTGLCEIRDHENKIIFLAPEGSTVKKGQIVVEFDRSKFEEYVSERETRVNEERSDVDDAEQELKVQKDANAKSIRAARQTQQFAKLDLEKYLKGDYEIKKSDLEGSISEAKTAVEKAIRDRESTRTLVKGGFTDYGSLREAEQVVTSAELRLKRDRQKLDMLNNYEHVKSKAEFEGKYTEAQYNFDVAKSTAAAKLAKANDKLKNQKLGLKIQERRLKELKENLARHTMTAPQDGTLLYARDNWRGSGEKIHEGKMLYPNQPVFILPDMGKMQVKVGVHESVVGKIKTNQPALIRVEAFSSTPLKGKVKSVALISDSNRWEPSNNYSVIVTIDEFPKNVKLKPGMTAKVEILVGIYPDVTAVPIQSIASFGSKRFAFVKNDSGAFEPREVTVGRSNVSFVSIESGLDEGDVVALDAYQRGLTEFGDEEPEEEDDGSDEMVDRFNEAEIGKTSNEADEDDAPPVPRMKAGDEDLPPVSRKEADVPESPNSEASQEQGSEPKTDSPAETKLDDVPATLDVSSTDSAAPALQLSAPIAK